MDIQEIKRILLERMGSHVNRSLLLGIFLGMIISSTAFVGAPVLLQDSMEKVSVTVVNCENCSYGKFENATDRMFNAEYNEIDYESERGQELVEKYDLNYVPGFIFDGDVREAEAFKRIKPTLVEFEDAYVIPDAGVKVAQRLSEGISLER